MAVLSVRAVLPTVGVFKNTNLSSDLDRFSHPKTPYESVAMSSPGGQALTGWQVSANGRTVTVQRLGGWLEDWYQRIHLTPAQLNLGNVVSAQNSSISLWNAWLEPRTLTDISGIDEGVAVSGQPEAPLVFAPLKELVWQITVTPDGAPVLDTELRWQFDDDIEAGLRITANRIIGWTFATHWGSPVTERLEALTDVLQSESAASQRRALRSAPRREFSASVFAEGRERQLLDLSLWGWSDRIWALPIWADVQRLSAAVPAGGTFISCATAHLDFRAGGLAMLRGRDAFSSETVEIEQVQAGGLKLKRATQQAWPAGSALYPARAAQLLREPQLSKRTDRFMLLDVDFLVVEVCDWPAWLPTELYRGRPVWARRPDDSQNLTHTAERLRLTLDSKLGQPLITDTARRALQLLGQRHLDAGRETRARTRSFIYAMAGRQKTVWVPSHMDDLTLVVTAGALATSLDVASIGYSRFANAKAGRRDIRIELHTGVVLHRRIVAAADVSSEVERLGLDSALGQEVKPEHVARISWMNLMRFESDRQEIEHHTDSQGVAVWATVFREERDDEF